MRCPRLSTVIHVQPHLVFTALQPPRRGSEQAPSLRHPSNIILFCFIHSTYLSFHPVMLLVLDVSSNGRKAELVLPQFFNVDTRSTTTPTDIGTFGPATLPKGPSCRNKMGIFATFTLPLTKITSVPISPTGCYRCAALILLLHPLVLLRVALCDQPIFIWSAVWSPPAPMGSSAFNRG